MYGWIDMEKKKTEKKKLMRCYEKGK